MNDSRLSIAIQVAEEGRRAVLRERIKTKLEVDDTRDEEGERLFSEMIGYAYGPTIFKRERKANGDRELPKPRVVAIGPYHRENSLRFDDDFKWKITKFLVNKLSFNVEKYLMKMEDVEENGRCYYSESLSEWSSEDFQTMLLLDSSFILFVINAFYKRWWPESYGLLLEYMTLYSYLRKHTKQIKLDLLMPDNQIPFFAIKELLECLPEGEIIFKEESIEHLALCYFDDLWPQRNKEQKMNDDTDYDHLLELFHWSRIPVEGYEIDSEELGSKNASEQYIPSATELRKSAIKFEKKNSGSNLDITFTRGLMKISAVINIPALYLYDYSEEIFRNLIAFEMNPTNDVRCFMAYLACMSCLLQREEDVKLLRESRTIARSNNNDAGVVQFFKDLNQEVQDHMMPDTLLHLYGRVMIHYNSRVRKAYGGFKLQYCANMWVGLSLIAASILFILTLLQTIYAIIDK